MQSFGLIHFFQTHIAPMEIVSDLGQMQDICMRARIDNQKIALVPTMGFFHEGHLSLMRWARLNADQVVVSVFVNPAQFGPGEDLDRYPRDLERDSSMARSLSIDFLFVPYAADLYPEGFDTWVETQKLSKFLCGQERPAHFRGVTTIVCKLFNLTMPRMAVFGRKDRQQLLIIKKMVRDLHMPVDIVGLPTIREHDGLAMSSRNAYLSPRQRKEAANVYKGLAMIRQEVLSGRTDRLELESLLGNYYRQNIPGAVIDYIQLVNAETLENASRADNNTFMAVALKLGRTRLIDNIELGQSTEDA